MNKPFEWLVDRNITDESGDTTRIDIKQEGVELELERLSYGNSAVVFSKSNTAAPFKATFTDAADAGSPQALTFVIALSGYMTGNLLNGSHFALDKSGGILADFSDGSADFVFHPGATLRVFSGDFDINTLGDLLRDDCDGVCTEVLREMTQNPGSLLRSFRVSPQIRQLVSNALNNTQLVGPLRRLYMEGVSLQILALILDQQQSAPLLGRPDEIRLIAHKSAIQEAAEFLLTDFKEPPTVAQLSRISGLSARKLNAGFREIYGYSVFDLLCEKRLTAVKDL